MAVFILQSIAVRKVLETVASFLKLISYHIFVFMVLLALSKVFIIIIFIIIIIIIIIIIFIIIISEINFSEMN